MRRHFRIATKNDNDETGEDDDEEDEPIVSTPVKGGPKQKPVEESDEEETFVRVKLPRKKDNSVMGSQYIVNALWNYY